MLVEAGAALDDLLLRTQAPVTFRRPWLQTWADCFHDARILGLFVTDGDRLRGAALLSTRPRLGWTDVVALGQGQSDQVRLPVDDPSIAPVLAAAVAEHLSRVRAPWRLVVQQLPRGDAVAAELTRLLPAAALVPGDSSPTIVFREGRDLTSYGSNHHRKAARALRRRLQRDGLQLQVEHLSSVDSISEVWPSLVATCRRRDRELGRSSQVDDSRGGPFFREVVLRHAARGELLVTTGSLNGSLAAYALCFRDGTAMRMWNTRFDPRFSAYGVGRLVRDEALKYALADPSIEEFDLMRGIEDYKLSTANEVVPAQHLVGWSSAALQQTAAVARTGKGALKLLLRQAQAAKPR